MLWTGQLEQLDYDVQYLRGMSDQHHRYRNPMGGFFSDLFGGPIRHQHVGKPADTQPQRYLQLPCGNHHVACGGL